jgi:hypothetical protein
MNFQLVYDGKALENNEISPRELSVALISVNDVLDRANQVINKGKGKIEIKVKASFETGYFKINFKVYQDLISIANDLLFHSGAEHLLKAKELLECIFDEKLGLLALLLFLKGAKPTKIIENEDGSFVIYRDTGVEATSQLVALFDTAINLPITPNGGDITLTWSNDTNRIFKL